MTWFGLDIGGANLKGADGLGWARSEPFALWREPDQLADRLATLIAAAPRAERIAATMTGELCDSFRTKSEGVRHILTSLERAAAGRRVRVYTVDGGFVSLDEAREVPHRAAASNWHALARFACRFVDSGPGLLIDVGSTTTDVVPLADGQPRARGTSDTERLTSGELLYSGVGRTPICAVAGWLPWRGRRCPVAAELFATTADAYVVLGDLPEQPQSNSTADGRPLTSEYAHERLARMICADRSTFTFDDARHAAETVRSAQVAQLRDAIERTIRGGAVCPESIVLAGAGEFLSRKAVAQLIPPIHAISIADQLGSLVSTCAPAHAVAVLAREMDIS